MSSHSSRLVLLSDLGRPPSGGFKLANLHPLGPLLYALAPLLCAFAEANTLVIQGDELLQKLSVRE